HSVRSPMPWGRYPGRSDTSQPSLHFESAAYGDLSFLRALEFPAWVTHLYNLQYLNVNGDEPRRQGLLSDDISHLTALTSLSLFGNNLEGYVPKSFSSFLNLQYL
ncbi:unnamed protein product, partial [Closterium sp. Naga37s-1]